MSQELEKEEWSNDLLGLGMKRVSDYRFGNEETRSVVGYKHLCIKKYSLRTTLSGSPGSCMLPF